jgi:hypothetical protein
MVVLLLRLQLRARLTEAVVVVVVPIQLIFRAAQAVLAL